jgi:ParB family chromosome partitioning protein
MTAKTLLYAAELDRWTSRAPQEPKALWGWLCEREVAELIDLLAVLVAPAVNVVSKSHQVVTPTREQHAALLETSLGLDMRNRWQPTAASYLGRIAKTAVLEAV